MKINTENFKIFSKLSNVYKNVCVSTTLFQCWKKLAVPKSGPLIMEFAKSKSIN
jgi:hypothetical protein